MNFNQKIALILSATGDATSTAEASRFLAEQHAPTNLHLRDFGFSTEQMMAVIAALESEKDHLVSLKSISFSFNKMEDEVVVAMCKSLPAKVSSLGLVRCGLGDIAGNALLAWMEQSENARMICIEENSFSENMKTKFQNLKRQNPQLTLIF